MVVLLFSGTLLCTVILTKGTMFIATFLYTFRIYWPPTSKGMSWNMPFVNKVVFGEYYLVRCDVYSGKSAPKFRINFLPPLWRRMPIKLYQITRILIAGDRRFHTHIHTHTYKHTPVETASCSKEIGQNMIIWHPQILRSFKREPSGLISKTIWHSYRSHVSSSYYVSRHVLASPPGSRNTMIYTHINSHAVLICRIGLDWLLLPAIKVWGLMELIPIYQVVVVCVKTESLTIRVT
jgi:hypothetical protein